MRPAHRPFFGFRALLVLLPLAASSHPGGVDKNGCHRDTRTRDRHCHSETARAATGPIYSAKNPPRRGDEGVLYGKFVAMIDGDTFKAKVQGAVMDFRLQAVDAPERDQPYGVEATSELAKLVRGRELLFVYADVDRYGRIVARVWVGNIDVNLEMISRGAAWFDSEYANDDELYHAEQQARDAKRGLWSLLQHKRIEPWVWRKRKEAS
jgi:endonuclease YncB( thermonuclease family)